MMKKLFFIGCMALGMCSCTTTTTLYSWYDYEDATYEYSKKRTDELKERMMEQYKMLIEQQNGTRGVVQPGLYAEYGFLLCNSGQHELGIKFLKKEIELYPEAEKYISRIIKQLEK